MKRFKAVENATFSFCAKGALLLLAISLPLNVNSKSASKTSLKAINRTQAAEVRGVKFAAPQGFELEQSASRKIAFMRRGAEPIALFVAVPENKVDDKYLTDLSNHLASRLLGKGNGFQWKILDRSSDRPVSLYQTHGGTTKGLRRHSFVQTDYVVIKAQGQEIVIGLVATFGSEGDAKVLFDVAGREYSVPGWNGLFQLIASITGEKYE